MPRYIDQLNSCSDPGASGDLIWIVDASATAGDQDRRFDAALLAWVSRANMFTRGVTAAPTTTSDHGFNANMQAGTPTTARAYRWALDGTVRGWIQADSANNEINLAAFDNGAGDGPNIMIGRNNNASTPAAGYMQIANRGGTGYRIWPDATGLLRIHTADPTNANDTAGTVVGTQTSSLEAKEITGPPPAAKEALRYIREAAEAVRSFRYKNGAYGGEEFSGLIVDYAPRYGMDCDPQHPAGKSLNMINAIGDLMIAADNLARRVAALESGPRAAT